MAQSQKQSSDYKEVSRIIHRHWKAIENILETFEHRPTRFRLISFSLPGTYDLVAYDGVKGFVLASDIWESSRYLYPQRVPGLCEDLLDYLKKRIIQFPDEDEAEGTLDIYIEEPSFHEIAIASCHD